MAASDFFSRWAKPARVADPAAAPAPAAGAAVVATADAGTILTPAIPPELTLADAASLTEASDFTPFMASHVDDSVRRLALKQLFTDPRFNVMDGLDTYIEDYNSFVPMDAAMVAALNHGKALLDPLAALARNAASRPEPAIACDPAAVPAADTAAPGIAVESADTSPAPPEPPFSGTHDESLPGL